MEQGQMYLGTSAADSAVPISIDSDDLTTHGVIVGMTGSGKTGLGVITIEEALLSGVPTLVIDPKGDMANLALRFPSFDGPSFRPWIDEGEAANEGTDPDTYAANVAERWKTGLAGSGIDTERMQRYTDVPLTIYTPGSTSGVGIDLIGSLDAPEGADPEQIGAEVTDTVSGFLGLMGVQSDPMTGREHILLSNLLSAAWSNGKSLDMPTLITQVQTPPLRKLGVMDLETFFPTKDRQKLALQLNGMLASPTFASWQNGVPLNITDMLWDGDRPKCAVVSIAHLSDAERQFVVTRLLSRMITWMRRQSGTGSLRALIYMDEVAGYVPPVKAPPTKQPILTILKQARAFGVGMILSTQNPIDLDYKAISNAGTWMIGRLQTEKDKERLLEGLSAADGSTDVAEVSKQISALDKRQFVLQSTHRSGPEVFATRWAMTYLAGPMTTPQISTLMADQRNAVATPANTTSTDQPVTSDAASATSNVDSSATTVATASRAAQDQPLLDDESSVAPTVPEGIMQRFLEPSAEWADEVGAVPSGKRLVPHLAVQVRAKFDETKADLEYDEEFTVILDAPTEPRDLSTQRIVTVDERDWTTEQPVGTVFALPQAKIATKTYWKSLSVAVRDDLDVNRTMTLFGNDALGLWSRPGETEEAFTARCDTEAQRRADEEAAKLRDQIAKKVDKAKREIEDAEEDVERYEEEAADRRSGMLLDVGSSILGGLLGGRRSVRGIATDVRRAANKRGMSARAERRVESAEDDLNDATRDLETLEAELSENLLDIDARWTEASNQIAPVEIGLERNDITITQQILLWVPQDH